MSNVADASNQAQAAYWNETAGPAWVAMQEQLDRQIEGLGAATIDALAPRPGERVVDIGCGCGQSTLELAKRVGSSGAVLGLDISRPMLDVARRRAVDGGLDWASFQEADAQVFAFPPGAFDGAYSRFGVMFFADPTAAFRNIRSGLRSGGRLAFLCWRAMAENPWMTAPLLAAIPLLPSPPPPPDPTAPGPFAFADEARVRGILEAAGFEAIELRAHDERIGAGSLEDATNVGLRVGPLGTILRENPGLMDKVAGAVRDALAPHDTADGVRMPSATWIVTATNP
jgi:SAM-dependent methyltransferase